MDGDISSLRRLKTFLELIRRTRQAGVKPTFVATPTEHGDNIHVMATINDVPERAGVLFWDVSFLQQHGLVDILDEDELALGLNITDGIVEDVETLLTFVDSKIEHSPSET